MLAQIKTHIKKNFGLFYNTARIRIFPVYAKLRNRRLQSFKESQYVKASLFGTSFIIKIDPKNGFIDEEIFFKGVYEEDILKFIKNEIKNGDVFFDVGANIGEHSLFASKIVGDSGLVVSFEPNREIYAQFMESVARNNSANIKVFNFGLGIENKTERFYINKENAGGSSLLNYKNNLEETVVEVKNGDQVIKNIIGDRRIDFIKIDVEGFEYEVLIGLHNTIQRFKPKILLEYSPIFYKKHTEQDKKIADRGNQILGFLISHNYSFKDLESTDSKKVFSDKEEVLRWGRDFDRDQTNIFCFVNESSI